MPKKKPTTDTNKLNQIDAYTYPEYDRANIPPVGMARFDTVAQPRSQRRSVRNNVTIVL